MYSFMGANPANCMERTPGLRSFVSAPQHSFSLERTVITSTHTWQVRAKTERYMRAIEADKAWPQV